MLIYKPKRLQKHVLQSILILMLATGSSLLVSALGIGNESIIMVFLLGVLFTTVLTSSYVYGIITSVASLMFFNFLFTDPRFTFIIYSSSDIVLLLFFLVTAVVSGIVTSRLQQQMELAAKNERAAQILYKISSGFLSVSGKKNIILRGISYIHEYVAQDCIVKLDGTDEVYPDSGSQLKGLYHEYKIRSSTGRLGVMQIFTFDKESSMVENQSELIIQAVATQLAIALDREQLYSKQESIRMAMEHERLKATLLRSIAHDLRSPLTGLSGAANLLADDYDKLSYDQRKKLASDISEESTWLISLVENILNMTRINDEQLVLQKEEEVVDDVVSEALVHVDRLLRDRKFTVQLPDEVVTVHMDGKLIVKVLINLLENAVRHTPPSSEISLAVVSESDRIVVSVSDTGNGVGESIKDSLFDRFVTVDEGVTDGKRGIGLGLAICRAIIEAHGGSIYIEANRPKGSKFIFTLPMEK